MKRIAGLLMATALISGCSDKTPKLATHPIDVVVAAMTLEEKANLIVGTGMPGFTNADNAVIG